MPQVYGTVISTFDSPSTRTLTFVIDKNSVVRRGQFVQVDSIDGKLIARVNDILKTNMYFMRPETVRDVESSGRPMDWDYPVHEHEYLVAEATPLGVFLNGGGFSEANFPASPGTKVEEPDTEKLARFFGLEKDGLHLGKLKFHDVDVKLNITKMLQKHLAILAISGAGKSYLTAVLLEELLNRDVEKGQIATIIIDPHGEYSSLAENPDFAGKVKVFSSSEIRIGLPNLSAYQICKFVPEMSSGVQDRELNRIIRETKKDNYTLNDLIKSVEADEKVKSQTKEIICSLLENLNRTGLFGIADYPKLSDLAKQGGLAVIDLSKMINLKHKQMIVYYIASKLFECRRGGLVPPFLLIMEESHQFAPEKSSKQTISKGIIETIAREGRKFHACLCLISQRPVQLSTTALSQCNTQIILKVTNPYDIKHIEESSEGITRHVARQISNLQVGSGLIVGEAVNFPIFLSIRKRKSKESGKGKSLETAAIEYQKKFKEKKEDSKAFM